MTLTLDTYSHVLPAMLEESARKLEAMLGASVMADLWQKQLGDGLMRSIQSARQSQLKAVLQFRSQANPSEWVHHYLARAGQTWSEYERMLRLMLDQPSKDLVSLAVVVKRLEGVGTSTATGSYGPKP